MTFKFLVPLPECERQRGMEGKVKNKKTTKKQRKTGAISTRRQ